MTALRAPLARTVRGELEEAVLRTLAYADVFDHALSEPELHRYLIGTAASATDVSLALAMLGGEVARQDGLVALSGRDGLFHERRRRRRVAAETWPVAIRYARAVGSLPFVRMVAITGALAVGNAAEGADIDLLVVTERGRLWTARAASIAIVRFAAYERREFCPNYFLAEHALAIDDRDLYRAHELTQMVPVTGAGIYDRLRDENRWTSDHLPNAAGAPLDDRARRRPVLRPARPVAEAVLRTPIGGAAEAWEQRKIHRFQAAAAQRGAEAEAGFSVDRCKGHLEGHGARIRDAYEGRAKALGLDPRWRARP